jgi:hypothetical protein
MDPDNTLPFADDDVKGMRRPTSGEGRAYRRNQWAHGPSWATYDETSGEHWFGFAAVRQLTGQTA